MSDKINGKDLAIFLLATPPLILFKAYIVAQLWTWFLVPLGVPEAGLAHIFGVVVLVMGLLGKGASKADVDPIAALGHATGNLVLLWAAGAVCHGLMP